MKYEYVKVLLYAYPKLPQISEAVGVSAENKACLSFRAYGSAWEAAERVAEEICVRRDLDAAHAALHGIVESLTEAERFLLEYKYFRRKQELKRYCGTYFSERTYYRRQRRLLKKIAERLAALGWTEEEYLQAFGGFSPFRKLYAALCAGRERQLTFARKRREIGFKTGAGQAGSGA